MKNEMTSTLKAEVSKYAHMKAKAKASLLDIPMNKYIESIILNDTSDMKSDENQMELDEFIK